MENENQIYNNIKSKHILKRIFKTINKNKLFNIIRYNKKLQKIFGLGINNYKDTFEKIIIEIIPKNSYRYDFVKEILLNLKKAINPLIIYLLMMKKMNLKILILIIMIELKK